MKPTKSPAPSTFVTSALAGTCLLLVVSGLLTARSHGLTSAVPILVMATVMAALVTASVLMNRI